MPILERWCEPLACIDPVWEDAYRRFESPEEEIRKFQRRLVSLGANDWPRDSRILELCCGRGNGIEALRSLGFTALSGVDLSESLLETYGGPASLYVGDVRDLRLADRSIDIAVVQGGFHHLPELPGDLEKALRETRRVLRPEGRLVLVEPWNTTFLRAVHACCNVPVARKMWGRLDALATMIERERATYEAWLGQADAIRRLIHAHFRVEREDASWGKLSFVGRPLP